METQKSFVFLVRYNYAGDVERFNIFSSNEKALEFATSFILNAFNNIGISNKKEIKHTINEVKKFNSTIYFDEEWHRAFRCSIRKKEIDNVEDKF